MAGIATYNAKRDFKKTPEPKGAVALRRSGAPEFVVQKHDASRLHAYGLWATVRQAPA